MKQFLLFFFLFIGFTYSSAQIVTIPDANFKDALVNFNVVDTTGNGLGDSVADTNSDGEIQVSEAEAVISLIISYYEVVSLEGIQSFSNLEVLKSRGNFVETIDLSQNTNLTWLHLSTNPLVSIDVSNNTNLERLWVYNNGLSTLDVSQNPNLNSLRCYTNNLTSLNIANGNNMILTNFLAYENPNLICIQVDDIDFANNQTEWQIDDSSSFSENCELGVGDETLLQFVIYPNPAKKFINIISNFNSVKIIDIYGQTVNEISETNKIDVSQLVSGIYFFQFIIENKTVIKKVVIN